MGGGLLLQTGDLGRLDVAFGPSGAGLDGSLLCQCTLPANVDRFLLGDAANLVGFDVAVLVAFGARHPHKPYDEQNCCDRDNDNQNDCAGSHLGSVWWSVVDGFIGGGAAVVEDHRVRLMSNPARYELGWGTWQFVTLGLTPK